MIDNWTKFYEAKDSDITYEMCQEVVFFRNFSTHFKAEKIFTLDKNFVNVITDFLDEEEEEEYEEGIYGYSNTVKMVDKLYNYINSPLPKLKFDERDKVNNLRKCVLDVFKHISTIMKGFPKFYEIEDIILEHKDNGYEIDFSLNVADRIMIISITGHNNIDKHFYVFSQIKSIIKRIQQLTSYFVFLHSSDILIIGDKDAYDFSLSIKISEVGWKL